MSRKHFCISHLSIFWGILYNARNTRKPTPNLVLHIVAERSKFQAAS